MKSAESWREPSSGPWWKFGHVWLVVSGPLGVVCASLVTYYLAVARMDPVVDENYYQKGVRINQQPESHDTMSSAHTPAQLARNHAATGGVAPAASATSR